MLVVKTSESNCLKI